MAFTIGTLSFARCGDSFHITAKERVRLILAAAEAHQPDILLTAGHAVHDRKNLNHLTVGLANLESGTTIVTEVHHDSSSRPRRLSDHALYTIHPDGTCLRMGRQIFAKREETEGKDAWRVALFAERAHRRLVEVGGRRVFVLGCGEIKVVKGGTNARFIDSHIAEAILTADIILNPTHDRMGRGGLLDAKRRFLSQPLPGNANRVYVSCSNWNLCTESGVPQYPSATIHTCYVDGLPIEPARLGGGDEWGFVYRQICRRLKTMFEHTADRA